jgi:hypothetical protein
MLLRRALILHLQYYKMKLFAISPFSPSRQRYILDFVAQPAGYHVVLLLDLEATWAVSRA